MTVSHKPDTLSRKERVFNQREQDILEAALRSFHSDEWESVTVAQIAKKVGIAKGTMYLHFASKHEIYARLALDFNQALLNRLREPATGNAISRFRKLTGRAFEFHLQSPVYRRVTQYCEREDFKTSLDPQISAKFHQLDSDTHQVINTLLIQGIDEGVFKLLASEQLILGLRCTYQGALSRFWCNSNNEQLNPKQFVDSVTDYMLNAILIHPILLPQHAASPTTTIKKRQFSNECLEPIS